MLYLDVVTFIGNSALYQRQSLAANTSQTDLCKSSKWWSGSFFYVWQVCV